MAFQDILAHVRPYGSIEPVEVALRLGGRFDARVTCLYPLEDVARMRAILTENSAPLQTLIDRDYAAATEAERRIRSLGEREGVDLAWCAYEGEAADLIAIVSRLQELVVVGKTEPGESWGVVERIVTVPTGRPILVVPSTGPFFDTGKCVLVAWNGSAQAADAVLRGMPLLVGAERVVVLSGSEDRERLPPATPRPQLDVVAFLKRHGIEAEMRRTDASGADAGMAILDAARDVSADLVVMGAFGRSRLREWVLGGATRTVLDYMHIPVLMAH
ncbi:universal stress protein [Skermanella pratensis]|uniref:universal stress protein n=1 Tax=Skermanella pratensis TaxID=2233999 RepID=UPI001301598A|nr:universal stress protein [Skermanella pratensis]